MLIGCEFKFGCKVEGFLTITDGNLGVVESTLDVAVEQLGLDGGHEEDGGSGCGDGADRDVANHGGDSAGLTRLLVGLNLCSLRRRERFRRVQQGSVWCFGYSREVWW